MGPDEENCLLGVLSLKEDPEVCQGARVGLNEVWGVVFGMALT